MLYRYRIARVRSEIAFQELIEQDRQLLAEFGLRLVSVDVGVNVVKEENVKKGKVNSWDLMSFDERAWGIMLPLLEELKQRRQAERVLGSTRDAVRERQKVAAN